MKHLIQLQRERKPFTVDYAGFGWLLIKHGVFEDKDEISLVCSEDAGI